MPQNLNRSTKHRNLTRWLGSNAVSGSTATESIDHSAVILASHAKWRWFSTTLLRNLSFSNGMLGWQQNGHEERSCTWLSRRMFLRRMVANNSFMAFDHSLGRMGPAVPSSQANDPTNFGKNWQECCLVEHKPRTHSIAAVQVGFPNASENTTCCRQSWIQSRSRYVSSRACAQENLGRHWHCAEHQVHLCPNCAELPPEVPTISVGARYFGRIVPSFGLKSF